MTDASSMVQGAGFEPAKHYAQRPERCPFDHSGTPARFDAVTIELQCSVIEEVVWKWCRGQDLNLRSTTHWDLNPAPLTTRVPLLAPCDESLAKKAAHTSCSSP